MHFFFLLLLLLAIVWSASLGAHASRGVALWGLLVLAVGVRELARGMAAAALRLPLESVLLLPTGGLQTYETAAAEARAGEARVQRWLAPAGPAASALFGLTVGAIVLSIAPGIDLSSMEWISPAHLLRAMVWFNLLLAALNLLPAWPLDAGRVVRGEMQRTGRGERAEAGQNAGASAGIQSSGTLRRKLRVGPMLAVGLVAAGLVTVNFVLIMAGIGIFLMAQVERKGVALHTGAELVKVREVMLSEYSILSASATLEDAMQQARHTLQDVFPVVRAGNMVGWVGRRDVLEALAMSGNGYVQGIMAKAIQTAGPEDAVSEVAERVGSAGLVPVLEGERIVGILTPGSLQRAMGLVAITAQVAGRRAERDESR